MARHDKRVAGPLAALAPRRLEDVVGVLMRDEPVIALTGPRTVGKSTLLLHRPAGRFERGILDLDDLTTRRVVADDLALRPASTTGCTWCPSTPVVGAGRHMSGMRRRGRRRAASSFRGTRSTAPAR
jgi:hypothetical protein